MSAGGVVRLRDRRKPGHAWQDNELYDFFQPIIGAQATALYGNLSRDAYGVRIEYSARLMEERTGMSRMTIWRAMKAMSHLGMVRTVPGRGSAAGEIELTDLKELAAALGGTPVENGKSHVPSPDLLRRLRAECAQACVPQRDAKDGGNPPVCVPPRDAGGGADGTLVSQTEGVCVPSGDGASILETKHKTQDKTPPVVPHADARGTLPVADPDSVQEAVTQAARRRVCVACGWTRPRVERLVKRQLEQCAERREDVDEQAAAMAGAWRFYCDHRHLLRKSWSVAEFLDGIWRTPRESWPWTEAALEEKRRQSQAGVGAQVRYRESPELTVAREAFFRDKALEKQAAGQPLTDVDRDLLARKATA